MLPKCMGLKVVTLEKARAKLAYGIMCAFKYNWKSKVTGY